MKKCFISLTRLIGPFYFPLALFYLPFLFLFFGSIEAFWLVFFIFEPITIVMAVIAAFPPTIVITRDTIESIFKSENQKRFKIYKNEIKRIYLVDETDKVITDGESIGNIKNYNIIVELIDKSSYKIVLTYFSYKQINIMLEQICSIFINNNIIKLFPNLIDKKTNKFFFNDVFCRKYAKIKTNHKIFKTIFPLCIFSIVLGTIIFIGVKQIIILMIMYGFPVLLFGCLAIYLNFTFANVEKFVIFNNYLFYTSMQKTFKDEIIFDLKEGNINLLEVEKISINYINSVYDGITWKKRIVLKVADFHFGDGSVKRLPIGLLSTKNQKRLIKYLSLVKPIKIENDGYIDKNNFHSDDSTTL